MGAPAARKKFGQYCFNFLPFVLARLGAKEPQPALRDCSAAWSIWQDFPCYVCVRPNRKHRSLAVSVSWGARARGSGAVDGAARRLAGDPPVADASTQEPANDNGDHICKQRRQRYPSADYPSRKERTQAAGGDVRDQAARPSAYSQPASLDTHSGYSPSKRPPASNEDAR